MKTWNEKELKQIIYLWEQHTKYARKKIDRRKVSSKDVQQWAVRYGLALWRCNHGRVCDEHGSPPWSHTYLDHESNEKPRRCNWILRFRELGDPFQSYYRRFREEAHLPPEVLWYYVRQFIFHDDGETTRGWSIHKQKGWLTLNIYCEGHRWDPENKHLNVRLKVLDRLALAGYFIFQRAGTIYQICLTDKGRGHDGLLRATATETTR